MKNKSQLKIEQAPKRNKVFGWGETVDNKHGTDNRYKKI